MATSSQWVTTVYVTRDFDLGVSARVHLDFDIPPSGMPFELIPAVDRRHDSRRHAAHELHNGVRVGVRVAVRL